MTERRWRQADNWVGAEFEDSLVMLEIELGSYVGLNDTASAVWAAIERPATLADIVTYLRARFDVPAERCAASVTTTLDRFCEVGLAVPV